MQELGHQEPEQGKKADHHAKAEKLEDDRQRGVYAFLGCLHILHQRIDGVNAELKMQENAEEIM